MPRGDLAHDVGEVGEVRVANVVDPNYTVVAKFPKKLLPPRR